MKKVRITESQLRGMVKKLIKEELTMDVIKRTIEDLVKSNPAPYIITAKESKKSFTTLNPNNVFRYYEDVKKDYPNDTIIVSDGKGNQIYPIIQKSY
jgi:hypothetical protein